jgi:Penicillin binding protein transpeptidase domain
MKTPFPSYKANTDSSNWSPPVIRQVAIVMLTLCLAVPAVLYLRGQRNTVRDHEPVKTQAAMMALFAAIEPTSSITTSYDGVALQKLLPSCEKLKDHQGLPIMEDLAEQLSLLEQHLVLQTAVDGAHNAPLRKRYQLNVPAWANAVNTGSFGCEHAAQALRTLAGPKGAGLLANAKWQEHEIRRPKNSAPSVNGEPQASQAIVQMTPKSLAQIDPWRGWPGCIWLGGLQDGNKAYYVSPGGRATWGKLLCEQDGVKPKDATAVIAAQPAKQGVTPPKDSASWAIPKDLGMLLAELESLRLPEGKVYNDYTATLPDGVNRRVVGRNEVDVGFNMHLTIDPRTQTIAQQVAECYTGNVVACSLADIDFNKVGAASNSPGAKAMWEQAAARMTSVVVLDVATGRIDALASAHTPCYAQEHDGPFRDAGCTPLWTKPQRRPDALRNHAVFSDYMPGSTVKPIMASVFFEDPRTDVKQLSLWLAKSDSNRFNDELFCLNNPKGQLCDRPARVQQRASHLGWNVDCNETASFRCAKSDMLFGRRLSSRLDIDADIPTTFETNPIQRIALSGRMFVSAADTDRGNAFKLMSIFATDPKSAITCRGGGGKWHANNCNAAGLKPLVNEAEGQGQARATPLGVATMLSRLAAAANGIQTIRRPYLVDSITDAKGKPLNTAATRTDDTAEKLAHAESTVVRADVAKKVFEALAMGTTVLPGQDGTGHLICKHVFGANCGKVGKQISGKTGTPSFTLDTKNLVVAQSFCLNNPKHEDCFEKPIKWYVAAYKTSNGDQKNYDKVIAVMSERNWYRSGKDIPPNLQGRIHGVNDLNNISTEIAMRALGAGLLKQGVK